MPAGNTGIGISWMIHAGKTTGMRKSISRTITARMIPSFPSDLDRTHFPEIAGRRTLGTRLFEFCLLPESQLNAFRCVYFSSRHLSKCDNRNAIRERTAFPNRILPLFHLGAEIVYTLSTACPGSQLHGVFSPVWSASSTRSVSGTERPTLSSFTVTQRMIPSGSTIKVAR